MDAYIAAGGAWECADPCGKQADSPVQNCQTKSISGRFQEAQAKCGDVTHVQADGVLISGGATTTFRISRQRDNKASASVSGPMNNQTVRGLEWKAQRFPDDAGTDTYSFDVSADGVSATSTNQFGFFRYPAYGPDTQTHNCASGSYGWTGKYDIAFADDQITVTIKIKLINRLGPKPASGAAPPAIDTAPVSDADKASMKADIEGKLSGKINLYRNSCHRGSSCICPKPIKIVVEFVESAAHHEVNLYQGSGRANAANWTWVKTRDNDWAHETGHLLGWFDEYTGAGGATGSAPRWKANETTHVMNVGLTVPPEYGWDFRDWFATKSGESWTAK